MKITKKELNQIIKEEADRFLTIQSLESEKARIQKALNENYSMEEEACEESTMEEEEKTGFEGADAVTVEEEEKTGFEGADAVTVEEDMCEVAEGAYCEDTNLEEGWLKDMLGVDEKKAEARAAAKVEAETALKAGQVLAWKGKDTFKENKVVGQLTDDQRKEMMSKIEKTLDHSEKSHGYNSDFFVANIPGKDAPVLGATEAGPKTKLGQALAAIGGAAGGAKRMEESEIRKIFREEAEKAENLKKLQIQANKIISEIEKIGLNK